MSHFKKIYYLFKAILIQLKQWFLELSLAKKIILIVVIAGLVFLGFKLWPSKTATAEVADVPKHVDMELVSNLSADNSPVPLVGQVTSVSEATIRAEDSGQLTKVYKKLGDHVEAGEIIAEFENSAERAAVLQAQGAYEGAEAARDIAVINTQSTNTTNNDAKTNTINTIDSAYTTMDDLIHSKTDVAFSNPQGQTPTLLLLIPDSTLQTKIQNERISIETILANRKVADDNLTPDSDLLAEIDKVNNEAQIIKNYLDDLGSAYSKALPNNYFSQGDINSQKAVISGTRSTIVGTLSAISGSKTALQASITSQQIAGQTTGSPTNPDTAAEDASVKSALGAYDAALARLEDTIIRSPINGTLNSLTINTGDYVNQTTQVAVVSNNGALEIVAYVTGDDAQRIQVGSKVKINSTINGVVTRIASAIDPTTNKIEVRIGITDENSGLIDGESVKIEISGRGTEQSPIQIPLSAVKITPQGSYVFILTSTSSLQAVTVQTGTLLGDNVEIDSGLTPDMQIVKDARGLKTGEVVTTN